MLAIALDAQGNQTESLFQALNQAIHCHAYPPPPTAHLRLKRMYQARGLLLDAGYSLLAGADAHPDSHSIWLELCQLLLQMLSKSCLRVCQTAMRLTDHRSTESRDQAVDDPTGRPQESIGIFALSDQQADIGLFWLLRSIHAQMSGSTNARPRPRTLFWALVARSRLLAWDISIPHSQRFFSDLKSFPEKAVLESVVAFHFLEAGGPSEMIPWLMALHASRCAFSPLINPHTNSFHFLFPVMVCHLSYLPPLNLRYSMAEFELSFAALITLHSIAPPPAWSAL
jgi:hypothetical protein